MYIFRNYTIEHLFNENVTFSGYEDISDIPQNEDCYVWFYNPPVGGDYTSRLNCITGISEKLSIAMQQIPASAPVYVITLINLYPVRICETDHQIEEAIAKVNNFYWQLSREHSNVKVIDLSEFFCNFPPLSWINWKFYFLSQMIINPALASNFKEWWIKKFKELNNVRKKCLVLDLDNTLWDGVLGEDGLAGIKMNGDYPGNAFMYFQERLIELANSGVILAICSKNNKSDVLELWEKNPFVKLGPKYISSYRINWNNKADNIKEISKELNIGLDSMVFIDDNPTERELVRQQLPMVSVPDFPKRPYGLMEYYETIVNNYFKIYRLTTEDINKTEQYKANALRASEQAQFSDLTDFIRSLNICLEIMRADQYNIPRIAQMTQKTNQFNLTTYRYSEADINSFIERGDSVYCISVSDKFGDNGITGEIIIRKEGKNANIDTFLLSCRILGKNIENAFVKSVLNLLYEEGIRTVTATYIPTLKNAQVKDFYERIGFELLKEDDGTKTYKIDLDKKLEVSDLYNITIK